MARVLIRLLSGAKCNNWARLCAVRQIPLQTRYSTATSKQDKQESFWDAEGSITVDDKMTGDRAYLQKSASKKEPEVTDDEPAEIVRITKFGHIRLDSENPALEQKEAVQATEEQESLNFIDYQFFGDQLSASQKPPAPEKMLVNASEVPVDTNPVDQQYFYPNKAVEEKTAPMAAPSVSELEFQDNEVDEQYFGKKKATVSKANTSKVSAYKYLRTQQEKADVEQNKSKETSGQAPQKFHAEMIPDFRKLPNEIIVSILKKSILYNKDGIVALDKPYGMVTTDADGNSLIVLTKLLPALSQALRYEKLYTVHRLDRDTTGVLLLASNQEMAERLNKFFLEHRIKKKYLAITKGIPSPYEGTIDIPICEKTVGDRQRMALRPVLSHKDDPIKSSKYNSKMKSFKAVTHFRVIRSSGSAAFVELEPESGVRHQLRVHLSEGLSCPVLGDHKYSHDDKYAPQRLPSDILESFGIQQSKARNLPMHLHSSYVSIPELGEEGKDLEIHANLPGFFRFSMKKLKLNNTKK